MARREHLRAQMLPAPPARAEIHVRPRSIVITVPLSELGLDHPRILLTPTTLRLRSTKPFDGQEFIIPLPEAIDPREYRARVSNGVLDVVVHRIGKAKILNADRVRGG